MWGAIPTILTLAACGAPAPNPDLPPLQASSAHFRYHASSPDRVPAGILDGLEANRQEMLSYFGITDEAVIDYYLFERAALDAAGVCHQAGTDCAPGRQVMTEFPFHQHELIHAYFAGHGLPPAPIIEGVASVIGCGGRGPGGGGPVVERWQDLFRVYPDLSDEFYGSSRSLVRSLILRFGPERFADYYAHASFTSDAAAFAQNFQSFWAESIDDAWAAAGISTAPTPGICPCQAPAILPSPEPQRFVHAYAGDSHPLGFPRGTAMTVRTLPPTASYISLDDCSQLLPSNELVSGSPAVSLVQLDDEARSLSFTASPEDEVVFDAGTPLDTRCEAARALPIEPGMGQLSVLLPRGRAPSYLRVALTAPATLSRQRFDVEGSLRVCSDCTLLDCKPLSFSPTGTDLADGAVLQFDPSGLAGPGLATFATLVGWP